MSAVVLDLCVRLEDLTAAHAVNDHADATRLFTQARTLPDPVGPLLAAIAHAWLDTLERRLDESEAWRWSETVVRAQQVATQLTTEPTHHRGTPMNLPTRVDSSETER